MRIVPRSESFRRKVRLSLLMDTTVPSYWVAAEAVATATDRERTRAVRSAISLMGPISRGPSHGQSKSETRLGKDFIHAPQRPRPIAHPGGLDPGPGAPQHGRPRPPRGAARLRALLARGAPRHARARLRHPGGADRGGGTGHRADPRGQRRRDAPALQPAEGGGGVQHPGGAAPGADRPRPRPRARHRPDDDARAPARPPPGLARRLPRAARRAARPAGGPHAGQPPVRPACTNAARAAGAPGAVAARLVGAERDLGGRAWAALRDRRLHQPGRRRRWPPTTGRASSTPSASRRRA